MGDNSIIQIENVSKYFGKLRALDNVSLDVDRGEVMMIIDPSRSEGGAPFGFGGSW